MTHLLDYFKHTIYDPRNYYRQHDQDIIEIDQDSEATRLTKRIFLISMPFICLYKPLGSLISTTSGAFRIASHTQLTFSADNSSSLTCEGMQTLLAVAAFAGNYFDFKLGLYLTTVADITTNIGKIISNLHAGNNEEAFEQFINAVGSSLYLAIMMSGSLEITLASIVVRALTSAYQARKEWCDERSNRTPEAIAKALMCLVQVNQISLQISLIQRKNFLYSLEKYKNLISNISNGKHVNHLLEHPLAGLAYKIDEQSGLVHCDLTKKIDENNTSFVDSKGNKYNFGANFHGNGKGIVKGMNICFKKNEDMTQLDFKVNHIYRDRLQKIINEIETYTNKQELIDLLSLSGSNVKNISIKTTELNFDQHGAMGLGYQISFQGLGKIFIGASDKNYNQYDRVCIQMDKGKNLFDFHEILSFMNLDDALRQSAIEDVERMKIGHLFRIFCPNKATLFERTDLFFDLPIDKLKESIIEQAPSMKETFDKYLPRMELREILPGKMRFAIKGLADELRDLGAYGLTSVIFGEWLPKENYERVDMILRMGLLSSETRLTNGISTAGLSSETDFFTGGADSAFTQLVTKSVNSFDEFSYQGRIRLLYPLEVLETGTYQYHYDSFGCRRLDDNNWWNAPYLDRPNIVDFVKEEVRWPIEDFGYGWKSAEYDGNEVMIKERIALPPSGLVVDSENTKTGLIEHLKQTGMCQMDKNGIFTILGKSIDDFIHVGNEISESFFN